MADQLSGVVAIVTGSSRGIGRETARLLLEQGACVMLNGRNADRLAATAAALSSAADRVGWCSADVGTEDGARALIAATVERFGAVDLLINNAGISMRGAVADLRARAISELLHANTLGAIYPTVAALPHLRQRQGCVLFISTIAALWGFPGVSLYSSSKMALTAFAQAVAAEEHAHGVHAGVVYLGFTENDPDKEILSAEGRSFRHARRAQHSQAEAARAIIGAYRRRRAVTITAASGRWLARVVRLAPAVVRTLLARSGGRIHRVSTTS